MEQVNSRGASFATNIETSQIKYVVNQKLEHFDDVSFRELVGRMSVFLQNKICSFLAKNICIYLA
jgi:hypothetical protein